MIDRNEDNQAVSEDQKRWRIGLAILVLGVVFVLWAWGSWAYRISREEPDDVIVGFTQHPDPTAGQVESVSHLQGLPVYIGLLVITVFVGGYVAMLMAQKNRNKKDQMRNDRKAVGGRWAK